MQKFRMQRTGFTLLELLIFMGLFSVILVVLSSLFAATVQQQLETQGMSAVESDTAYILGRLQYDFDRADAVVTPASYGDITDTLTLDINGQDFTYTINGNSLELTNPTGSFQLQSTRSIVSSLSFQKIGNTGGNPTVRVQMTVSSVAENATGAETSQIDTIFSTR